jgi:type I restriction enzyme M protein
MLDTDTKRRIDTARDILVGKVPDPKSQVEQITIALIYKFMDDMDAGSEEMGGARTFFAGDFERYGWANLMRPGLGGHELLGLYSEGLDKMPVNEGIPPLFRDIFKNAYLPYRDPETLRAFLKIIDEFTYDHSERLGDAFEYLLSVLGSQGDAGQFRTPRHIIDFMVSIVDPKKDETVLDPACGTAGFLISSYKHILNANTDEEGNSTLTPDDKSRLAENFTGYDISPDMVRLSLANLYLHGFTDPHISEYDTLTSLDNWNEHADVILANPPFMSPKGGIKPHSRFSIQAKRSEVLFVDYMAEHLTPKGRAGIIVPEGIIFQSQTAYKDLRKMLVENNLVAVISLPSGVFNPYSGVKTSILILDKALAERSDTIAFFRVERDGYGLGAQRRALCDERGDKPELCPGHSDLAQVTAELETYLRALRGQQPATGLQSTRGLVVSKVEIAASKDYNLSGERYGEKTSLVHSKWPTVSLGDICAFMTGGTPTSTVAEYYENGTIPWLVSGDIHGLEIWDCSKRITHKAVADSNARVLPKDSVLIALNGQGKTRGTVALLRMENATCNQSLVAITPSTPPRASSEFVFWTLRSMYSAIRALTGDTERSGLNIPILKGIRIPLPPLEVQHEIVAEIEGYQQVISGARAVLDHYHPHIPVHDDWPMVELGEICAIRSGGTPDRSNEAFWNGTIPWVTTTLVDYGVIGRANEFITEEGLRNSSAWIVPKGTVVMAMYGQGVTRGRVGILGIDAAVNQACAVFQLKGDSLDPGYLYRVLQSRYEDLRRISDARGGNQSNLSAQVLKEYSIPLPPLVTQRVIVAEIDTEQSLVAANGELIARMEQKIQATLARAWGEESPIATEA